MIIWPSICGLNEEIRGTRRAVLRASTSASSRDLVRRGDRPEVGDEADVTRTPRMWRDTAEKDSENASRCQWASPQYPAPAALVLQAEARPAWNRKALNRLFSMR